MTVRIATAVLIACLAPLGSRATDLQERVSAQPGGTLRVDLEQGAIEVEGHEESEVTVDARAAGSAHRSTGFELRSNGRDVRLEGDLGSWLAHIIGRARVRVRIKVPHEYSLDLKTNGGAIEVLDIRGRVSARSSGGPVQVEEIVGEVDLQTSGGSIIATEVRGSLRADTSGGPIRIFDVSGDVDAKTSGGPIVAHEITGRVRAETSGGPISVRWNHEPGGSLQTSGGSIQVEFSDEFGVDLDAETTGGRVHVSPGFTIRGRTEPNRIDGELNGGGQHLQIRTSGGGIRIELN